MIDEKEGANNEHSKITTNTLNDVLRMFNAEYSLGMNRITIEILESKIKEHVYNAI